MSCTRCQTVPSLTADDGDLLVTCAAGELLAHVRELLSGAGILHHPEDGALRLPRLSIEGLLTRTAGLFHALERHDLLVLPLAGGEQPNFHTFVRARSLERWQKLLEQRHLLQLLEQRALTSWMQPIVSAADGRLAGYEMLLRAFTPDGDMILPDRIFAWAQEHDLLFQLDRLARETSLQCASEQGAEGWLFINFLPSAIYEPRHCLRTTQERAQALEIAPGRIVFEVVETARVVDTEHLARILDYYREAGFRIALDDVGSGYSSLNLIARLRPDILKVDMELVRGIHEDPARQAVFRSVAGIGQDLGCQVLAEGVETSAEAAWVSAAGADLLQGYLFARPSPRAEQPRLPQGGFLPPG